MKITFIIPTVGDGGNEITSSFLLRITNRQKDKYRFLYTSSLDKVATSKNRKKLEFPNLNSYLRVVVYYHADRLGLEVTKKDQSQNTKTLVVAKPKQNK